MNILNNYPKEDFKEIKYPIFLLVRDLFKYIKPYKWKFILATFLRITSDLVNLYPTIAFATIVTFFSKYKPGDPLDLFWSVFLFWVVATVWRNFTLPTAKLLVYQISEKSAIDAQLEANRKLFQLDIAWHEKENAGNKLKKIQKGGFAIDRLIRLWINNYIEITINFFGILYIISKIDFKISISLIAFLIVYFIFSFLLLRKVSAVAHIVNMKEEEMNGLVFQVINNVRSVKVLGVYEKLHKMIEVQASELYKWINKRILRFQARSAALNAWVVIFRMGSLVYIALGISKGLFDLGFLILFNNYFLRLLESVSELSDTTQDLIINKHSFARMKELIDVPVGPDDVGTTMFPQKWKKITLTDISFSYGDKEVIKNISFEINRGQRIGIVGLSGAGKSTLFKLLLKENEGYTGQISFDKIPLREINKQDYYNQVGVVLQDTEVFNFTLKENITIASDKMSDDALQQAVEVAHVSDFINKLPLGFNTFIGEKGVRLSGGEKQRLGIARAVYKKPQILFLDEATSHLDLESEEKIRDSLHIFFQKVTAIVIAHRLTTIKEMDKIIVIDRGELIEMGNFNELYQKKGKFYDLWQKQKL